MKTNKIEYIADNSTMIKPQSIYHIRAGDIVLVDTDAKGIWHLNEGERNIFIDGRWGHINYIDVKREIIYINVGQHFGFVRIPYSAIIGHEPPDMQEYKTR